MLKKLTFALTAALAFAAMSSTKAQAHALTVQIAPPAPIVETVGTPPAPDHQWIAGYWQWNGTQHVWVAGHWECAPSAGMVWERARWDRQPGGWVFVAGRWAPAPQHVHRPAYAAPYAPSYTQPYTPSYAPTHGATYTTAYPRSYLPAPRYDRGPRGYRVRWQHGRRGWR